MKKQYDTGYDFDKTTTAGIIPHEDGVIITGRTSYREKETRDYLKKIRREKMPIHFYPNKKELDDNPEKISELIGKFKAKKIKELGVKTFYEDNPDQIAIIKETNPDTEVVRIGGYRKKLKYLIFSWYLLSASVAWQLQQEGNVVNFAKIMDQKQVLTDDEQKTYEPKPDDESEKRRKESFKGIINSLDADSVVKVLKDIEDKDDYFVFTDSNMCFRYTDKAFDAGFRKGTFPKQADRMLEVNRDDAKEIVKKYYPGIKVKEYQTFKTIDEGIKMVQESELFWVLKSLGDEGETIVPKTDQLALNHQEIVGSLMRLKSDYEANGYLLEQKILNGVELTPEMALWNGKPLYYTLDIETKTVESEERGSNVGCATNLIIKTGPDDRLNKLGFPEYVMDLYKGDIGLRYVDIGLILDPKDGQLYFMEFCPNRAGWDSFPTEVTMSGTASMFFEKTVMGENPIIYPYGIGVRVFNDTLDKDNLPTKGLSIIFKKDLWDYVFPYDMDATDTKSSEEDGKKDEFFRYQTAGYQKDVAVITCKSDSLKESIDMVYESYLKDFSLKDMLYRGRDDFESFGYPQAVLLRAKYAIDHGIINNDELKKELDEILKSPRREFDYKQKTNEED